MLRAILLKGHVDEEAEIADFDDFIRGLLDMAASVPLEEMSAVYLWLDTGFAYFDVHAPGVPPPVWLPMAIEGGYNGLEKPVVKAFAFSAIASALSEAELTTIRILGCCCSDGRASLASRDSRDGHDWEGPGDAETGLEDPTLKAARLLWGPAWSPRRRQ